MCLAGVVVLGAVRLHDAACLAGPIETQRYNLLVEGQPIATFGDLVICASKGDKDPPWPVDVAD